MTPLLSELPVRLALLVASTSATATLGVVALLFFLRDRERKDLLLYALFAAGVAIHQGLSPGAVAAAEGAFGERARTSLLFLVPGLGYLFLLAFLELPWRTSRKLLAGAAGAGLAASLLPLAPLRPILPGLAGALLGLLGLDLLFSLWSEARKRRRDAPVLFLATALLLLAALLEVGTRRGILLLPGADRLLGPAFLVFSALVFLAVADERRQLLLRATVDALTGLSNRAAFLERARREIERVERSGELLAVVMIDIDHFKSVNDRLGHQAGDRVLTGVAGTLRRNVRGIDLAGRYGGEEFVLLLIDVEASAVFAAVERIREKIGDLAPPKIPSPVTVSAGIALHHGQFERTTIESLLRRADVALYRAKREGRDRTALEEAAPAQASAAEVRYR